MKGHETSKIPFEKLQIVTAKPKKEDVSKCPFRKKKRGGKTPFLETHPCYRYSFVAGVNLSIWAL